jgi:hypothetical protein
MKTKNQPPLSKHLTLLRVVLFLQLALPGAYAAYPDLILSNNPVAYYRLEETSGATAADSSVYGVDAAYTYNSALTFPQLGLPGITTNSILFNGGGFSTDVGSVSIPASSLITPPGEFATNGAPFSCELWVQPTLQPATFSVPLEVAQYPKGWNFYVSGADGGATSYFYLNMPTILFQSRLDFPIVFQRWYHLAVTFDGTSARFYVNGVGSGPYNVPNYAPAIGSSAHVGSGPGVGWTAFLGGVDEVAFYTNVLSPADILAHYQLGTNSFRAVPTPPGFLQQPASRTNFSGTTATFSVAANGTQPLSYQWKRGVTPITGATNNSYSFTATYPADDGATFSVTVTNSVGSTNSAVATLTVLTDLNILHEPFSITRTVGSKAAFRVVANGAVPISYQWFKVAGVTNAIPGATSDTLWLSNIQPGDDQSQYYAQLTNPFTVTNGAPATLTVQARAVNVPITGYARGVVADDPVAYWRLDEPDASGTATDAVGSFDGSYQVNSGTFTYGSTNGIPNETNRAVRITGGAVVSIPYALELNPHATWTVEAWVRPDSNGADFRTVLSSIYNFNFSTSLYGWIIYQHPASAFTLSIYNGSGGPGFFGSDFGNIPLNLGSWYHLVLVNNGTTIQLYVNSVAGSANTTVAGSGFKPNGINGDPALQAGAEVLGQRNDVAFLPFDGGIDDVAFYNYALSANQIRLHYLNNIKLNITKSGSNVVLTWPFGTLQSAPAVGGTYTNVIGATSPLTNAASATEKYYRVQIQP